MYNYTFTSKNENDTKSFAKNFAKNISTTLKFTEGFLSYFGLENEISSPTFTIVNEYHKNDINIFHFDVYRLEDSSEFYEIGGDEYFENGICLIEWGELIEDVLPKDYIHITFSKDENNENLRNLLIESNSNLDNIIK